MTESFAEKMNAGTRELNITLSQRQLEQFFKYYEMLVETNKVMNLTAITEEGDVVAKHFCDSLCLVKAYHELLDRESEGEAKDMKTVSVIDVGTGAGFPGIPLKIAFPQIKLTLLDSLNKRVKFLEQVCRELELENVQCIHGRAEDAGRMKEHREQYDLAVSRAVANLASLSEYCIPFVKKGGFFIPYKSGEIEEELNQGKKAAAILGGEINEVVRFSLPEGDGARSLIRIRKVKPVSSRYPRKAGMPGKEPLGK